MTTTLRDDDEVPGADEETPARRRRRLVECAVVLSLLVAVTLSPTLRAAFVYDDTAMIRDNPWLRGWGALLQVWEQPYWPTVGPDALGLYRPMHVAMLAAVWNLSGGSALAFHLYAITLAGVATLAVWWLLRRAVGEVAAFAGAALFAVHPLHVEVVASAANTSELLVVLGTVTLVRLLGTEPAAGTAARWRHALLVGLVAAATLLSKESGLLALPLALLTVWGWREPSGDVRSMRSLRVLLGRERLAIACASTALALSLLARAAVLDAPISRTSIAAQGLEMGFMERAVAMTSLWPRIAGLLVWPTSLAPFYGPSAFPSGAVALATAAVLSALILLALSVRGARRGDRRPLIALAWIGMTYLPASNLLVATGQIMSDRTLFGATVGIVMAMAWAAERWGLRTIGRRVGTVLLVCVLGAFYHVEAYAYAKVWSSHRSLWAHLVRVAPEEHLGYKLLGMDARARRDHERAIVLLMRAHAMAPSDRQARFELGQSLYASGRFARAAAMLAPLMRDGDASAEPALVALYLEAVGRAHGAAAVVDAAQPLMRSASAATAALFAGLAWERLGRSRDAESAYAAGLRAAPGDAALRSRLGLLAR